MFNRIFLNQNQQLLEAAISGNNIEIKRLLEKKADINALDDLQETALIKAVWMKQTATVKLLLDKKANINLANTSGNTALHEAVHSESPDIVQPLLDHKPLLELKNQKGRTPLLEATLNSGQSIDLLLRAKANVNAQDNKGHSPLFIATTRCSMPMITNLLSVEGINLSLKTKGCGLEASDTALSYAAKLNWRPGIAALESKLPQQIDSSPTFEARLKKIGYEGNIPQHLICPISLEIINDPITVSSGATFDRQTLKNYFSYRQNPASLLCPAKRRSIEFRELYYQSTWVIKDLLEDFVRSKEIAFKMQDKEVINTKKPSI